ncbi:hypothetical protein HXX76_014284 [Chlamydomonas incerta]|uniref:Ribosomal RNA-processing protein 12-like conserved domain-containing protein n=1 Tax=Chlamydomonas incerta TaxID=51695 RepID=A0A835VSZ8_CHLIN|nr:hypothetical protein HXX76_014284 [Chlamydomonas incerta]|eukprot:KAG2424708.1 hypothetical protein HXX76_014284 [Chlamydomonas incerta]
MVSEYGGDADGGVAAEVAMRFGRSGQPDSQQVVAVLKAITDVIRAEGLPVSPTSYFAAIMSALEKPDTQASQQVALAMLTLLSVVLPRVPAHVLRSKFAGAAELLGGVLAAHRGEAAAAKAALGCLAAVLAAADPGSWLAAVPGLNTLLAFVTDGRPKVRKRAVLGLVEVLAGLQRSPGALGPASELVLKVCQRVLPGPAAAAHAAAAASNKQRAAAEAAITAAVADALHLLGALKQALPLLAPAAAKSVTELMLKLYGLKQPLLDRHVTEALAALAGAGGLGGGGGGGGAGVSRLGAADLADLITVVLETESLWAAGPSRDPGLLTALGRLLEAGFGRLAEADPAAAAARLPRAVHALVPGLAAEQDGVRFGTSQALRSLILDCLTPDVAAAARRPRGGAAAGPSPLASLVAAVAGGLSSRYQDAWGMALPVVGALIERLGALGAADAAAPLLVPLGAIVSGAVDAADDADAAAAAAGDATAAAGGAAATAAAAAAAAAHSGAAEATLGVALKCLGPEVVLKVLPLQITEALAGGGEPRTWLLPLMRRHVRHTRLGYWFKELMPLAQQLGARAAALSAAGGASAGGLALKCRTLELQIWHCLPAFMSWAVDLPAAYAGGVNSLAAAFANRPDLQPPICAALARACMQVRHVLAAAGRGSEFIGHADPAAHGPAAGAGAGGAGGGAAGDDDDDDDLPATPEDAAAAAAHGGAPPESYGEAEAEAALAALRAFNAKWLSVLCAAYLAAGPEARAPFAAAIAAAAAVTPEAAVAGYFRAALQKLTKLIVDEAAEVPPPDAVTEGGGDPAARRSAFLELALWLSYGLGDNAVDALFKAVKSALVHSEPGVQKRGFKVLAVLCEARGPWLAKNLKEVLKQLLGPSAVSTLSAARRHRLRLIRPVVVALQRCADDSEALSSDVLGVEDQAMEGGEEEAGGAASAGGRRRQLVASLVADIVLCTKEANMKTRAAAYDLLVGLAHLMDQADPGPGLARLGQRRLRAAGGAGGAGKMGGSSEDEDGDDEQDEEQAGGGGGGSDDMEEGGGAGTSGKGGLYEFFSMVMAGLVATTPHMVSATVMALARLTFEFASAMQNVVAALLPPVLSLLRGKAREIVKAVLGFVKVCAMRLPVELLTPQLGPILEGMLIWAEDSKNKFKLKVRVIVERLARRCGFDAVAAVMPPGDAKLLSHIRKEAAKKQRRKAGGSEGGSEAGDEDGRSRRSAGRSTIARTARASQWGETAVFSSEDGGSEGAGGRGGARSVRSAGGPKSVAGRSAGGGAQQQQGRRGGAGAGGVRLAAGGGDPLDLLDAAASRQLVRSAAGVRPAGAGGGGAEPTFTRDPATGKMVIAEEAGDGEGGAGRKRRRGKDASGYDSDDSDFDDLKGVADLKYAMKKAGESKSVRFAEARSQGGRSVGGHSAGGRSEGGRSAGGRSAGGRSEGGRSTASRGGKSAHSGDRFKAKGATGDVKGKSKVDPYAYWTLDRRMLNRRRGKQAAASAKLESIVGGAQAGALKGAKAKRSRDGQGTAKRQRTTPASVE